MNELAILLAERISAGLKRKSVTSCSRWAEMYRIMGTPRPGPWSFYGYRWLKEMHDSQAELNVGQKGAQVGFTEAVLNKTLYEIDVNQKSCLYILPARSPDASDFSASRFDPALELSPHISGMFSDTLNVGHKRAGSANLFIRGSRSKAGLKSIPTPGIVIDEVDACTVDNIPLAFERSAGQYDKWAWLVSTPTIDDFGINFYFKQTSQNHVFFRCPSCSRLTQLVFPDSIVITADDLDDPRINDSHYICKECKAILPNETKSDWLESVVWVESFSDREKKGWTVNQMHSPAVSGRPSEIAKKYLLGHHSRAAEQEFFNSAMGVPHVVDGGRVTDAQLNSCTGTYTSGGSLPTGLITMGVDVGNPWMHVEIDHWVLPPANLVGVDLSVTAKCRVIHFCKVRTFSELDELMLQWRVHFCVIDAQPERRATLEFANRFYGHVLCCFYPNGIGGKQIHVSDSERTISVDRTSWLDLSLGRFRTGSITIPADTDLEYRAHIKSLARIYEEDKEGNPIGRYVKGNVPDHYAHARNYAEIALPLAMGIGESTDIVHMP